MISEDLSSPTPELEPLLDAVRRELIADEIDHTRLRASLERLLVYLSSPEGRTDANCVATEQYFSLDDEIEGSSGDRLPEGFRSILFDIGGTLHDTVSAPRIAENFQSTPEQLLLRVRALPTEESPSLGSN